VRLTRDEYLRLLSTAKKNKRDREYLFVKAFTLVGLKVSEVQDFTVELIKEGVVPFESSREYLVERKIPKSFKKELLAYAKKNNIESGPIFITRSGKLIERTKITSNLKVLCQDSGVSPEKVTPRAMRNLYFETVEIVHQKMIKEMTKNYLELVEKEVI
jgi:site-specific recombinase XerC